MYDPSILAAINAYHWLHFRLENGLVGFIILGMGFLSVTGAVAHPSYELSPNWAHCPMVVLATLATIMPSEAALSGGFSLPRQAIRLRQLPAMGVLLTDRGHIGPIYNPFVNWELMVTAIGLAVSFQSSDNLASAYGLIVATDRVITTSLAHFVARRFGWNRFIARGLAAIFLIVGLAF